MELTCEAARTLIAGQSGNYRRFETYDTRRPAKRAWGELLEQFLRSKGARLPSAFAQPAPQVSFPARLRPYCAAMRWLGLAAFIQRLDQPPAGAIPPETNQWHHHVLLVSWKMVAAVLLSVPQELCVPAKECRAWIIFLL